MLVSMSEARARGARVIVLAPEGDEELSKLAHDTILIPRAHEYLTPILSIIPLQLLCYHIGQEGKRGNLDRPRNLAKSVTVE